MLRSKCKREARLMDEQTGRRPCSVQLVQFLRIETLLSRRSSFSRGTCSNLLLQKCSSPRLKLRPLQWCPVGFTNENNISLKRRRGTSVNCVKEFLHTHQSSTKRSQFTYWRPFRKDAIDVETCIHKLFQRVNGVLNSSKVCPKINFISFIDFILFIAINNPFLII